MTLWSVTQTDKIMLIIDHSNFSITNVNAMKLTPVWLNLCN